MHLDAGLMDWSDFVGLKLEKVLHFGIGGGMYQLHPTSKKREAQLAGSR